jgi:hypothetical protein
MNGEMFNMAFGAAVYTLLIAAFFALLLGFGHKDD